MPCPSTSYDDSPFVPATDWSDTRGNARSYANNYTLEAYLTGQEQDRIGRILDLKQLKLRMNGWIDDHWDHTFFLWKKDENGLAAIRSSEPHRIYELKSHPTAENCCGAFSRGYLSLNSRGNRRDRLLGPPLGKRRDMR